MTADPESLGPYRIVRRVGAGGMGVVYEAVHTGLDKRVALKVLPRELAAGRLDRFLREARTAAALHHTNIVPVFDVGQVDGVPYYAMQFIDGQPLGTAAGAPSTPTPQLLPETRPYDPELDRTRTYTGPGPTRAPGELPGYAGAGDRTRADDLTVTRPEPRPVVALILQAAEGLAHAHARGVVHRDVKPANLILDADGVVWVADFGLAFRTDDPTLTTEGAILGTPRYMSPEQARAEKTDCRTDVYSLGVTLYELLTGTAAFPGDTPMGVVQKVLTHTPPRPRALNRKIPRDLETVVLKAMAKNPADRYPSGRELADDLRRFLAGEPVAARRITLLGRAWRWAKRNPAVASLLVAVLTVFAAGTIVSVYFAHRAEEHEHEARKSEQTAKDQLGVTNRLLGELSGEKAKVDASDRANRRLLYAARMGLASVAYREGALTRVDELLRATFPGPGEDDLRGWEWHYLFRAIHTETGGHALPASVPTDTARATRYFHFSVEDELCRVTVSDAGTGRPLFSRLRVPDATDGAGVTVSDDGRRMTYRTAEHLVVWDVDADAVLLRVPASPQGAENPALSATGDWLARSVPRGARGVAYEVWAVPGGKRLCVLTPPDEARQVATGRPRFGGAGRWLAAADFAGGWVVWDVAGAKVRLDRRKFELRRAGGGSLHHAGFSFSADGRWFAVKVLSPPGVELYDLDAAGDRPTRTLAPDFAGEIDAVELAPDGAALALTNQAGDTLSVVDVAGRQPARVFRTPPDQFHALSFTPDGTRLVAYAADRVREWDLTRVQVQLRPLADAAGKRLEDVLYCRWARDGRLAITQTAAVPLVAPFPFSAPGAVLPVAPGGAGRFYTYGVVDPGTGRIIPQEQPAGPVERFVAAEQPTGDVVLRDRMSGQIVQTFSLKQGHSPHFAVSGNERWFVHTQTCDWQDPTPTTVVDLTTGQVVARGEPRGLCEASPLISPDGRWVVLERLANGSEGGGSRALVCTVVGGEVRKATEFAPGGGKCGRVQVFGFSPDGRWFAARNGDRRTAIHEVGTWHPAVPLAGLVDLVVFDPAGTRALALCREGEGETVRVWDLGTGQELLAVPCTADWRVQPSSVSFDGRRLTMVVNPGGVLGLETLDGTPVPDALARERLGIR